MKIELPRESDKVVSIEIAKNTTRFARRLFNECVHNDVQLDTTLMHLTCNDCGKEINPVMWLAMLAEDFEAITRKYEEYRKIVAELNGRSRTKCLHCGKMTPVKY